MNDAPVLKTPGEMIRESRESRGLTIAQLSERTKIPPPVLTALEMDEYHKISGPLYIKSFLRTCAMDLGLDPDVVLSLYNKISGEKEIGTPGAETVWGEEQVKVSRIGLPWLKITVVVGVAAILLGLGLFALRGCGDDSGETLDQTGTDIQRLSPEESVAAGVAPDSAGREDRVESLIPAETEADLQQRAEAVQVPAEEASDQAPVSSLPAGGETGTEGDSAESSVPAGNGTEAEVEAGSVAGDETPAVADPGDYAPAVDDTQTIQEEVIEEDTMPEETVREETPQPVEVPVVITSGAVDEPDSSLVDDNFMDSLWPLVLSITCETAQDIKVKRDDDREYSGVRWPAAGEEAPPVPEAGFEAGRAYRLHDSLVVFWGAEDHFNVILEKVRGVEVAVNGVVHEIARVNPGQELVLDRHAVERGARR